ncbi:hypothetical protein LP414_17315 [Polaromonas sp. P1(28)-13]|nr:hypothetical protein LP417_12645 [Polaromonas sp. P1-6]UUZ74302.1 hypothetical protein LP414_17315 [Polaromonas sp. P1(28)-13]
MIQPVRLGVLTPSSNTGLEQLASAIAASIPLLDTASATIWGLLHGAGADPDAVRGWGLLYGGR